MARSQNPCYTLCTFQKNKTWISAIVDEKNLFHIIKRDVGHFAYKSICLHRSWFAYIEVDSPTRSKSFRLHLSRSYFGKIDVQWLSDFFWWKGGQKENQAITVNFCKSAIFCNQCHSITSCPHYGINFCRNFFCGNFFGNRGKKNAKLAKIRASKI